MRTVFILEVQNSKHKHNLFSVLIYLYGKIMSSNRFCELQKILFRSAVNTAVKRNVFRTRSVVVGFPPPKTTPRKLNLIRQQI